MNIFMVAAILRLKYEIIHRPSTRLHEIIDIFIEMWKTHRIHTIFEKFFLTFTYILEKDY
jgi:hypothetical protein